MDTLKLGSRGESVKRLQQLLDLYPDGIFGRITEEAVKAFQQKSGITADGIVGAKTWEKLTGTPKKSSRYIKDIILHCSATAEGKDYTVSQITQWHKQRGYATIGYHYVIYRDGSVHEGRDINLIGAHCEGHNTGSIGICYIGGLSADGKTAKDTRTEAQRKSLVSLVRKLLSTYLLNKNNVHCHNDYTKLKACPSFSRTSFLSEL